MMTSDLFFILRRVPHGGEKGSTSSQPKSKPIAGEMVKSSLDTLWVDDNPRPSACTQKTIGVPH